MYNLLRKFLLYQWETGIYLRSSGRSSHTRWLDSLGVSCLFYLVLLERVSGRWKGANSRFLEITAMSCLHLRPGSQGSSLDHAKCFSLLVSQVRSVTKLRHVACLFKNPENCQPWSLVLQLGENTSFNGGTPADMSLNPVSWNSAHRPTRIWS